MSDGQTPPPADTPQPEGTPGVTPPPPAGATPPPGAVPPPGAPGAYPQQGYAQPGYPTQPQMSPTDEKTWAILLHLSPILISFIGPLIGYLVLKDRGPFISHHAKQALNFNITVAIGYLASALLMFVIIGFVTYPIVAILAIVFAIIAAVKTNQGEYYRYPLAIQFIK
ncbi:DUF4870 domain-containing protein [Schumannella soli]|nr:DUF4870 domain-containing protein [Schumannella soli]